MARKRIGLFIGHSVLKSGAITSADGTKFGGFNEYKWNKDFSTHLKKELVKHGFAVDVIICPEKTFKSSGEESGYKIPIANSGKYDVIMELHLNAFDNPQANGTSVLYYPTSASGKKLAECIQSELIEVFKDRKIEPRQNLYMLRKTKPTAVMLETFFCTCPEDCKKADKKYLAKLVATGVCKCYQE